MVLFESKVTTLAVLLQLFFLSFIFFGLFLLSETKKLLFAQLFLQHLLDELFDVLWLKLLLHLGPYLHDSVLEFDLCCISLQLFIILTRIVGVVVVYEVKSYLMLRLVKSSLDVLLCSL